jgi:hypothetical protein
VRCPGGPTPPRSAVASCEASADQPSDSTAVCAAAGPAPVPSFGAFGALAALSASSGGVHFPCAEMTGSAAAAIGLPFVS